VNLDKSELGQTEHGQTELGQTELGQTELGQTELGVEHNRISASSELNFIAFVNDTIY
jgi:hypothetical protein